MSSPSSPSAFLFPSAFLLPRALLLPTGFLLPTGPLGPLSSSAPTGLLSPSSPTELFSPFSPRTEKAAKAEHAATDETPPTGLWRYREKNLTISVRRDSCDV